MSTGAELMSETMAYIEANPELLEQCSWLVRPWWARGPLSGRARLRGCFAGHAVCLAGWEPVFEWGVGHASRCRSPMTGEVRDISDMAERLLGLSREDCSNIYYLSPNLEHLRAAVSVVLART